MFEGKVVLVTGGNRNTGLWIVKKFVDEGARVFMCGSSEASTAKRRLRRIRRRITGSVTMSAR